MDIKPGEITDILKREIKDYGRDIDVAETGNVLSVGDGIARVYGLDKVMAGELVEFRTVTSPAWCSTSKRTTSASRSWARPLTCAKATLVRAAPAASTRSP